MSLLQFHQVTLAYGALPLLDSADLQIEAGERICLVGRNGTGKTSLMRLITGEENPSKGTIVKAPGIVVTYLTQEIPETMTGSVMEVIRSGLSSVYHEEEWESDRRLENLAVKMGLPLQVSFDSLSGGLKRRVLLARALAGKPDLLLLDEPTNHLDLETIIWLEEFLLTTSITLFFVTHDRAFLKKLATRIIELDRGILTSWKCDYPTYLERKAAALEAEEKEWATFDKKLALEEAWLRQGVKARRTRNEGRVRALLQLRRERGSRRERETKAKILLQEGNLSGQKVIDVKDICFQYGEQCLIQGLTTTIWRGDKIGIIGPNGSGKTTLLKLLLGELQPTAGSVQLGTKLEVLYFDQLRDNIDGEKSVAANVAGDADTVVFQGRSRHIHSYLEDFLFHRDRVRMPAKMLSGGERNRLLLAKLFLQPANLLIMDEPTNDLDAETMELLEELVLEYQGTLLLVSHDRAFLNNVVTSTLVFESAGKVSEYCGGYDDWIAQRPLPKAENTTPSVSVSKKGERTSKPAVFLKREQRELEELPAKLEQWEQEKESLSALFGDPELYRKEPTRLAEIQAQLQMLEKQIAQAYLRWEELEEKRHSLL